MSQNEPKKPLERNVLGKKARRRKVFALKAQGKDIDEIAEALGVSNSTVDRDLKSSDAQAFIDALVRRQIVDIESAKLPVRLQYRSDLLDKLSPRKPAVNVDVNVQSQSSVGGAGVSAKLAKYQELIAESVAVVGVKAGDLSKDDSAESLRKAEADGKAGSVSSA